MEWCESCVDNYAFYCEHCEQIHDEDYKGGLHTPKDGESYYCGDCAESELTTCEKCNELERNNDTRCVKGDGDDEEWCGECADAHAATCEECGDLWGDSLDAHGHCSGCACDLACASDGCMEPREDGAEKCEEHAEEEEEED